MQQNMWYTGFCKICDRTSTYKQHP